MNQEDYCSYELSKKLADKGFSYTRNCHNEEVIGTYVPTLYQAQKWLRNEIGIHILLKTYIVCCCDSNEIILNRRFLWSFELMRMLYEDYKTIADKDGYRSFEEALSAGITKALELI